MLKRTRVSWTPETYRICRSKVMGSGAMGGIMALLCCATSVADAAPCKESLRQEAKKLLAQKKVEQAIKKYEAMGKECLVVADWWELARAYEGLGRFRDAFECNTKMAEQSPPDKRAEFLKDKEARLKWAPPCSVFVGTRPGGATVMVDGQDRGMTPNKDALELKLKGGKHKVTLWLEGYKKVEASFTTEFGESKALTYTLQKIGGVAPPEKKPEPSPVEPTPELSPKKLKTEEPEKEDAPPPIQNNGVFVGVQVGPAWADYGDPKLSAGAGVEVGLDAGYLWRELWTGGWLGFHVHATMLYTPVVDSAVDEQISFIHLLAGAGARINFWRLWADVRFSLGAALLTGASEKSFFFDGAKKVSGTFANIAIRTAVGIGWTFYKGLYACVYPMAIDYMPSMADFNANISGILRYQVAGALGWEF